MGRRDDFVARLHSQGAHGNIEGVRAIGAGDAMLYTQGLSPRLFKCIHLRPADEGGLGDGFGNRVVNFRLDGQILGVQVNEGDFHRTA